MLDGLVNAAASSQLAKEGQFELLLGVQQGDIGELFSVVIESLCSDGEAGSEISQDSSKSALFRVSAIPVVCPQCVHWTKSWESNTRWRHITYLEGVTLDIGGEGTRSEPYAALMRALL